MQLYEERQQIVEYGKKMIDAQLTTGTGGNISIYNRKEQLIAIKPSGIEYHDITPQDIVILDQQGNIIEGNKKPSSELSMHKIFYEKRQDINAIVHSHSTNATTLACLGEPLKAIHYLIAFSGSDLVECTPYAPFGTQELAELAYQHMQNKYAVLLGNHGILTAGPNITYAYSALEELEFCAELYLKTKTLGGGKILTKQEINTVLKKFSTYGQKEK